METTRRDLTKATAATALAALASPVLAATPSGKPAVPFRPDAWHQRLKRIVQLNFTEKDPATFELQPWIDYLVATKAECTFVSITNNVAFYPTRLPDLPVSRWLNGRDVLGECVHAAKAHGIRNVNRLSTDLARLEVARRHPEWFQRRPDGSIAARGIGATVPGDPSTSPEYGATCAFTGYHSVFVPQLIDEVMTRYPMDGVYTNGWPGNRVQVCYCDVCRKIGDPKSDAYRIAYEKRIFELVGLFNDAVRRHNKEAIYSGNFGSATRGGEIDLKELMTQSVWMFADNQGRPENDGPSWDAAQQNRVAAALIGTRPVVNSTGAWANLGTARWRTVSANPAEVRTRMYQTFAAGGTVHLHWLGFEQGFHEDRRWQQYGLDVLPWQAANDRHFHNLASLANVAMVVSPQTNRLYKAPPGTDEAEAFQGAYKALTEARIPFDIVLDTNLQRDRLAQYDVLVLPNIALMSDATATDIKAFVARGGSVLSTFETGLYDATGKERPDFALAALFGMRKQGARLGFGKAGSGGAPDGPGPNFMQRIEQAQHPILAGFRDTNWIAGSAWRVPIAAEGKAPLTVIPQYAVYPVEAVFTDVTHTDVPAMIVRERGKARLVHLAGDIESGYWRSSTGDLGDLFVQAVSWLTADRTPVRVEGDGLLEIYGWRTEPGYALHLVNHTNPNFRGGALRKVHGVGTQTVRMTLADAKPVRAARLLHAGATLPFRQEGRTVEFAVPTVLEYEVAALEL